MSFKNNLTKIIYGITLLGLWSCSPRIDRLPGDFSARSQKDPALSGNGQKLALIVDQNGRPTVQLRDLRNGQILQLRHLSRYQPHSSPSLSWNARYLAVIAQQGNRRLAIIEDLLTGRSYQMTIPGARVPVRLSLSPDASKLAFQLAQKGKWRIELFDLTNKIDLDQPTLTSPGASSAINQ